ncbi:hypothetical protein [Candidatus Tisiphia endosymbiont of Micropterix aruncella]|uniref:hypothetical protein n=1 Tax=Candidatus Tisiphia endosymbiont of Micropterix aruncella TaxID=3066271 RepID=UPI003AA8A2B3
MKKVIDDYHREMMKRSNELDTTLRSRLSTMANNAQRHHQEIIKKNNDIVETMKSSQTRIMNEFGKAKDDRRDKFAEMMTGNNLTREMLNNFQEENRENFKQAQDNRTKICDRTLDEIKEVNVDVSNITKIAEDKFSAVSSKMFDNHYELMEQAKELEKTILTTQEKVEEEFKKANDARSRNQQELQNSVKKVGEKVSESRKKIDEKLNRSSNEIQALCKKQTDKVLELRKEQKQGFEAVMLDRQKKSKEIEQEVLKSREIANEQFDKTIQGTQNLSAQLDKELQEVQAEVLKSREEANKRFDAAKQERKDLSEQARKQFDQVHEAVLKSNEEVNKRFSDVVKQRQDLSQELAKKLGEQKNLLESIEQAEQNYEIAWLAKNQLNQENKNNIGVLNSELQGTKEEIETNFDKAKKDRDEIDRKIAAVDNDVNQLIDKYNKSNTAVQEAEKNREDVYSRETENLEKASYKFNTEIERINTEFQKKAEQRDSQAKEKINNKMSQLQEDYITVNEEFNKELEKIDREITDKMDVIKQANEEIKALEDNKQQYNKLKKLIADGTHPVIQGIKDNQDSQWLNYEDIKKVYQKATTALQSLDKSKVNAALNTSIKFARIIGNNYQFQEDILQLKKAIKADIFRIKDLLLAQAKLNFEKKNEEILAIPKFSSYIQELKDVSEETKRLDEQINDKTQMLEYNETAICFALEVELGGNHTD